MSRFPYIGLGGVNGDSDIPDKDDCEVPSVVCKRCGADNLYWAKLPRGWTLHDYADDRIHVCRIGPNRKTSAAEDFK